MQSNRDGGKIDDPSGPFTQHHCRGLPAYGKRAQKICPHCLVDHIRSRRQGQSGGRHHAGAVDQYIDPGLGAGHARNPVRYLFMAANVQLGMFVISRNHRRRPTATAKDFESLAEEI